ncbi:MAG: ATP-binding cassette domain-containing protein, partial [Alphaproteobacteria bacterium]
MTLALKATGISKDFPVGDESVRVLFDVAVDIRLKELTMLVGPSGCGKTTLISILSGILSASAGDIWVMG